MKGHLRYTRFELKNITFDENKLPLLANYKNRLAAITVYFHYIVEIVE